jgi:hypothetical protein
MPILQSLPLGVGRGIIDQDQDMDMGCVEIKTEDRDNRNLASKRI